MLYKFLIEEREEILKLCTHKILRLADSKSSSYEMERGLPLFYDELIEVLRKDANKPREESNSTNGTNGVGVYINSAASHGKESLKLGYSVSQVVHGYGAICQAITQYVGEKKISESSAREYNRLNLCLDIAIAEAVTEYDRVQRENAERDEVQRLGFLAHELRNALTHATIAYRMIKTGKVGSSGNTAQILEDAHTRMRDIIDRSLAEVRLRSEPTVQFQKHQVIHLISEVEVSASVEANAKSVELFVEAVPELEVFGDRHLIISALSNLVQNAIKFTKPDGIVWIRAKVVGDRILLEIEDQCGGLPQGKAEEIFKPFSLEEGTTQSGSGLGLGLKIARRAISLNNGMLTVLNMPHQGCVFTIDLPVASSQAAFL